MKTISKKASLTVLVLLMVLALVACGSDDDDDSNAENNQPTMDIVETAVADGRFTTLVTALEAAELDDDLAGDGPFTVFAPTDDAFAKIPAVDLAALLADKTALIDTLTFHVFSGDLRATDVASFNGTAANMLNSKDLRIDVIGGEVILSFGMSSQAKVIITDILATNGVIHVIDVVLNPANATEDIVDTALAFGFTDLATNATTAGLVGALRGDGPLTVFAPTNTAFGNLVPGPGFDLADTLLYHVFDGSVLEADAIALDGQTVAMLNGDGLTITVTPGGVVLNNGKPQAATVTTTNILCSNGTIHVIDTVLDPNDAP